MKKTGTWAEINLENLEFNLLSIKQHIDKTTKVCGVVKANAYGHGAVEIAKFLEEKGIDYLAVARIEEGLELRVNGIKKPILCMGALNNDYLCEAIINNITITVFDVNTAILINKTAKELNSIVKIHLKIDSGMNRLGFKPSKETVEDILYINSLSYIELEGIFTHFAKADEYDKSDTYKQLDSFKNIVSELESHGIQFKFKHVSNSASIIDLKELGFNMVRAGISLYGLYPSEEVCNLSLKPVLKLRSRVTHSKIISKGDSVSYGYNFTAIKDTQIVTISIGYADGFPRVQKDGFVLICDNGVFKVGNIVGNICMDQCMVTVEDRKLVSINSEVFIIDNIPGITPEDIAKRINTINYEILCMISRRVSRLYYYKNNYYSKNYLF